MHARNSFEISLSRACNSKTELPCTSNAGDFKPDAFDGKSAVVDFVETTIEWEQTAAAIDATTSRVTENGTFIDGIRVSETSLSDLNLLEHRSIRLRIEVPETAEHPGGINIFGRGFGNYDQDIVLRLKI